MLEGFQIILHILAMRVKELSDPSSPVCNLCNKGRAWCPILRTTDFSGCRGILEEFRSLENPWRVNLLNVSEELKALF